MSSTSDHKTGEDAFDFDPFVPLTVEELNDLIPGYEFVQFIDRGGMGAVYKAVQKSLGRMVAVKLLPPVHRNRQRFAERFAREARALALLNHPHIVSVYDSGETEDGHMFYAMEFVTGTDLSHLLRRESLSPKQILTIITQVCGALQFAHEQGVVHRDIKPANILIDERGNVKVADFGLAKVTGLGGAVSTLTATGATMGTPIYIAPEAMAHEATADHRADIYSLGVMIYEMLTGQVPKGVWEPPSKLSGTDARLDEVVTTAMQSDPEKRYQHVSDMTLIIQKLLEHGEVLAGFDTPRPRPADRKPAGPSANVSTIRLDVEARTRQWRKTLGVAAATAVVMAVGFYAIKKPHQPAIPATSPASVPNLLAANSMTAAAEQINLVKWVFDKGGFVNVLLPGRAERLMGDVSDIRSAGELPPGAFAVWRISMSHAPLADDKALEELISLCQAAGTVANLNLRGASVTPDGLRMLQRLDTLTNLDIASSHAVTVTSVPHIAACKNLTLLRIGGAGADDMPRITQLFRSLRPDCEISIE